MISRNMNLPPDYLLFYGMCVLNIWEYVSQSLNVLHHQLLRLSIHCSNTLQDGQRFSAKFIAQHEDSSARLGIRLGVERASPHCHLS